MSFPEKDLRNNIYMNTDCSNYSNSLYWNAFQKDKSLGSLLPNHARIRQWFFYGLRSTWELEGVGGLRYFALTVCILAMRLGKTGARPGTKLSTQINSFSSQSSS